jgi:hypothetical protein
VDLLVITDSVDEAAAAIAAAKTANAPQLARHKHAWRVLGERSAPKTAVAAR